MEKQISTKNAVNVIMKNLFVEAIGTLCKNGIMPCKQELSVEGLIGVTLDKSNVFLVNIKETFGTVSRTIEKEKDMISANETQEKFCKISVNEEKCQHNIAAKEVDPIGLIQEQGNSKAQTHDMEPEVQVHTLSEAVKMLDLSSDLKTTSHEHLGDKHFKDFTNQNTAPKNKENSKNSELIGDICSSKYHKKGEDPADSPNVLFSKEKVFAKTDFLEKPQRTRIGEKSYKCIICMKNFASAENLRRHKITHTGKKTHKCETCMKQFARADHLNIHRRIHMQEKPFKCDICMKTFTQAGHLKTHKKLVHTREKPNYTNNFERKDTFGEQKNKPKAEHLKRHEMSSAKGKTFYYCNICQKGFRYSGKLVIHLRTHTGEKPFRCNVCMKKFAQRGNLTQHLRTHTGEKT